MLNNNNNSKLTHASLPSKCWRSVTNTAYQSQQCNRNRAAHIKRILVQRLKNTLEKFTILFLQSQDKRGLLPKRLSSQRQGGEVEEKEKIKIKFKKTHIDCEIYTCIHYP